MTEESSKEKLTLSKKSTLTLKKVVKPAASEGRKVVQVEVRKKRNITAPKAADTPKVEIDQETAQKLKLLAEAKEHDAQRLQKEKEKEALRRQQEIENAKEQEKIAAEKEAQKAAELEAAKQKKAKAEEKAAAPAAKPQTETTSSEYRNKKSKDYDDFD